MLSRLVLASLLLLALTAAAQTHVYTDSAVSAATPAAKRVLFIPPDISVSELSAGGVIEKVPDWSKQARGHMMEALRKLAPNARFEIVVVPALTTQERESLDEHTALYEVVAVNVQRNGVGGGQVWTERLKSGLTDYTLGPGLAFLADKTGADAALFVIAQDFVSTSERKALAVVGALFGAVVPLGRTFAVAGLVELRSGKLLWQAYDTSVTPDLRVAADADKVVKDLFQAFPGNATAPNR